MIEELVAAGFVDARITTLSAKAPFVHAGIPFREIRVEARTPAPASDGARHRVVYKGPMAQVVDDSGHVYRRGAVTAIPARDSDGLAAGPLREAFLFLGPEPATLPVAGSCCSA